MPVESDWADVLQMSSTGLFRLVFGTDAGLPEHLHSTIFKNSERGSLVWKWMLPRVVVQIYLIPTGFNENDGLGLKLELLLVLGILGLRVV
jgi:hypothetical protein